jgi:hypothetical protein
MNSSLYPVTRPRRRSAAPRRLLSAPLAMLAAATCLYAIGLPKAANAQDDVLQQAINYVFTGTIAPKAAPEITDREACVVVLPDPKWKRFIRYYLARMDLDDARIQSTYAGRQARYQLDAQSDQIVVEYLNPDKTTVMHGYKSAQIPLPGNIDQTKKAFELIAERCKDEPPKLPF